MSDNNYFELEEEVVLQESLEGRVLVASTALDGSCFERSLIYICAHDANGALGVIFNRQIGTITLQDMAKHVNLPCSTVSDKKFPVMFGGPVDQNQFMILTITKKQQQEFDIKQSLTCHTDIEPFLKQVVTGENKDKFILAQGITSWDAKQLLDEIEENSWLVTEPTVKLLFSQKIRNKWQHAVNSLGVQDFSKLVSYSGNA